VKDSFGGNKSSL